MRTLLLAILVAASAPPTGAPAQSAPDAHILRRERGDVIEIREVPAPVQTNCRRPASKRVGAGVPGKAKNRMPRRDPGKAAAPGR